MAGYGMSCSWVSQGEQRCAEYDRRGFSKVNPARAAHNVAYCSSGTLVVDTTYI